MPSRSKHACMCGAMLDESSSFGMNKVSKLLISPACTGNSTLLLQLNNVAEFTSRLKWSDQVAQIHSRLSECEEPQLGHTE